MVLFLLGFVEIQCPQNGSAIQLRGEDVAVAFVNGAWRLQSVEEAEAGRTPVTSCGLLGSDGASVRLRGNEIEVNIGQVSVKKAIWTIVAEAIDGGLEERPRLAAKGLHWMYDEGWSASLRLAQSYALSGHPIVRNAAARILLSRKDLTSQSLSWRLMHDSNVLVRQSVVEAIGERCKIDADREWCLSTLGRFKRDAQDEVAFLARDVLRSWAPREAYADAPFRYKEQLLATLAFSGFKGDPHAWGALRSLFVLDEDPRIRALYEQSVDIFEVR